MDVSSDFFFTSVSGRVAENATAAAGLALAPGAPAPNPLGPLSLLPGRWVGRGFNQIWRPHQLPQDRFLELNETIESLEFEAIPGDIPNRGFLQADINLHGIRYLQQIQDAHVLGPNGKPAGIHLEPGLWVSTPSTSNPNDPATVARMASIPHGTTLLAQGATLPLINHAPPIAAVSIAPFPINQPQNPIDFPEVHLNQNTAFRTPHADIPNVTQAMVNNPNIVLAHAIAGQNIVSTTTLRISTKPLNPPTTGGGTSNIAFLQGAAAGPNALSVEVDAIFWIETIKEANGTIKHQLQYTQTVLLNFNRLSWPHVTVATLVKQ